MSAREPESSDLELSERWAHRLDPDLAAERASTAPPQGPPPSARPAGASRYGWFVGVVAILAIAYISLNTLSTGGLGQGIPPGRPMAPFAVPLATSNLVGDANLAARTGGGAGRSGRTPACAVSDPRALTLCRAAGEHPFVLAFFSERDAASVRQLDVLQAVASRHPEARFAAVALKGDRERVRALVRKHHWSFPVGYDRGADVGAAYGVPTLPSLTFAHPGRIVAFSTFRLLDQAALDGRLRALSARPPPRRTP